MNKKGDGPTGWVLDASAMSNEAERICARCEAEYQEIFSRLAASIGQMQARNDGDALMLLQKIMMLAVNEIQDHFASRPLSVAPDPVRQ